MRKYQRDENVNLGSLTRLVNRAQLEGQLSTKGKLSHRLIGDRKKIKRGYQMSQLKYINQD